jgi:endonuclease YncB( thermonuclease family)
VPRLIKKKFKLRAKQYSLFSILLLIFIYTINSLVIGYAHIVDGDTLHIGEHKIRLYGIDAVEKKQKCETQENEDWDCGLEAKRYLEKLVQSKRVVCWKMDRDRYTREVSICYNSELKSLNAEMVKAGYAVAYTRYSSFYIADEEKAKTYKQGIWKGKFIIPERYRIQRREK